MQTNLNSVAVRRQTVFSVLLFTQIIECHLITKDFGPGCSSPSIWMGWTCHELEKVGCFVCFCACVYRCVCDVCACVGVRRSGHVRGLFMSVCL